MSNHTNEKINYRDAGVDVEKGNELVQRLKRIVNDTNQKGVIGGLGGFGGLFDLSSLNYKEPVLVSGTHGVRTKIKLAIENNLHDTIGIDLVAMCVNDVIVQGAKPLFFLDYFVILCFRVKSKDLCLEKTILWTRPISTKRCSTMLPLLKD